MICIILIYYLATIIIFLQEVKKNVRSILNKITPENMTSLTERFKALSIDSIERLEKTIDLVFEKVIFIILFLFILFFFLVVNLTINFKIIIF